MQALVFNSCATKPHGVQSSWTLCATVFLGHALNRVSDVGRTLRSVATNCLTVTHTSPMPTVYMVYAIGSCAPTIWNLLAHKVASASSRRLILALSHDIHGSVLENNVDIVTAGTFNCPLCGKIWRFKCRQVRQIKPAQLAFGRTIK